MAPSDPFAALADPTRRRILELLAGGERSAGEVTADVRAATGLSQPAVSQHLAVLREAGLVDVRADGARRMYSARAAGLAVVAAWVEAVTPSLAPALDALATEVVRGKRERRGAPPAAGGRGRRRPAS